MIDVSVSASGHYVGDCRELLKRLPDACVQTCITSPPYCSNCNLPAVAFVVLRTPTGDYQLCFRCWSQPKRPEDSKQEN